MSWVGERCRVRWRRRDLGEGVVGRRRRVLEVLGVRWAKGEGEGTGMEEEEEGGVRGAVMVGVSMGVGRVLMKARGNAMRKWARAASRASIFTDKAAGLVLPDCHC